MYVHCVPAKSNMQDLTKIQTSTSDAPTLPRGYPMIINRFGRVPATGGRWEERGGGERGSEQVVRAVGCIIQSLNCTGRMAHRTHVIFAKPRWPVGGGMAHGEQAAHGWCAD